MLVQELLVNILEDLGDADFRKFQWYLSQPVVSGYKAIPKSRTEKKTREEIVDEMVQSYCEDPAVTVAVEILRKIHHNAAAETLSKQYAEINQAEKNTPPPASTTSSASPAPPNLTVNAASGGIVIIPTISNTSIGSSFNMNIK